MTSVTLGPLFDRPLHPAPWCNFGRDRGKGEACPRYDYRVTNAFDGPDLVNGGLHRATDVGNASTNHPVLAPVDTTHARGLKHTDGALGVEFVIGGTVTLELWHLNRVYLPPTWAPAKLGQRVGLTGATGGRLQDGSRMPAHTHVAGKRDGMPFDIEPHLVMPERPAAPIVITLEEDDMLGSRTRFLRESFVAELLPETAVREDIDDLSKVAVHRSPKEGEPWRLTVIGVADGATFRESTEWWVYGASNRGLLAFHSRAATRLPVPAPDCTAQDNKIAAARTAVDGAAQAIAAAQRSLA